VAALFEHATFGSMARPVPLAGIAEVRRLYDRVILYDGLPRTRHVISNVIVEFGDATTARSRCRFTVLQSPPGAALTMILAGRYHDRFQRLGGTWWFADRLVLPDLAGDLRDHMAPAGQP
jgi:hypothetical protein